MSTVRPIRSRYLGAIAAGLCAAWATYLPPLDISARVDGKVFDLWSRAFPGRANGDIVLVELDDAEQLRQLVEAAAPNGTRLIVTTIAGPPEIDSTIPIIGPTELALGPRLLRRTEWHRGGHLMFEADSDGIVRADMATLNTASDMLSLAAAAHDALGHDAAQVSGHQGIRFSSAHAFTRFDIDRLPVEPDAWDARIVVAGTGHPSHDTPVGPLAEYELVAHALDGYISASAIQNFASADLIGWIIAGGVLSVILLRPRNFFRRRWLPPVLGTACLLGASGAAFAALQTWIPVAGAETLLLTASALLLVRPSRRQHVRRQPIKGVTPARELLAAGRLQEAWLMYRNMPPTRDLMPELYQLGAALDEAGASELAADAYFRIALVDVRYEDVARRLVHSTHWDPTSTEANMHMRVGVDVPTHLGRYELLEPIGRGSTGRVFLAHDPEINRVVALKVIDLRMEYDDSELGEAQESFRREVETAGRLNHPNIITVYDVGECDRLAYIAMDYLKGRHLSDFTSEETLLPPGLVLELAAQTADALDYAHDQNVVHRDIKPSNIMYDSVSGSLKITDFGIARLIDVSRTRTGIVLGTPSFMAPEQLEGKNVNGHTDLFALGVSLYELLTGRLPFRGASMTKLMFVIANEPHQPITAIRPDLPPELDSVLDIALCKDPDGRYHRGAAMAEALRTVAGQLS